MARKRRIFDIEMPEAPEEPAAAPEPETFPAGKTDAPGARRGPMAAAISEVSSAARERRQVEAEIRAENDALAHEFVRLRKMGLVVELVPLDAIDTTKLVRDRQPGPDMELSELTDSIRSVGLSNPIRVERAGERFELVQGFRRLAAYRALLEETGDAESWGAIPAAVWEPGDTLPDLYRRMVDENMVRKDISFAEMAQLALEYAADPLIPVNDPDKAVAELFQSAGYQKRSYIRSFIKLVSRFEGILKFPSEIPRSLGLSLARALDDRPDLPRRVAADLEGWDNRSVQDELGVLRRAAGLSGDAEAETGEAPATAARKSSPRGSSRTSFRFERAGGPVKCTAATGRLELRLDRDFASVDRQRLERAISRLLDELD